MNTQNQQSQSELPSPILDTSQKKPKSSLQKPTIQHLDQSESLSQKDANELLENLSKIDDKKEKDVAQSLYVQREWHPADDKSDVFADNARNDNINQSTEIDISMKQSGRDKANHRKQNPYDQPIITELEDSLYLEQTSLKESKILRKTLGRIKQNKDREWIEPNFDIFDDPDLDDQSQVGETSNRERQNSINVNYVQRKEEENPNNNQDQMNNIPPGLGAVLINMINSVRGNNPNNHQQIPPNNNHFLHPQINAHQPPNSLHSSFHPSLNNTPRNDNFISPMAQTQHFHSQLPLPPHPINPPTPRSEAGWNQRRPQTPPQSSYQQHNQPFSGYEIMNEIKYLRQDVKMLREQWKEDRTEKLIHRLEQKLKSESRQILRERKGSDSYDKSSILSFEVRSLLDEQERRHQRRMRDLQNMFMDKIHMLQKEQNQLREQNSILRKRSMFKHTESHEFTLTAPQLGLKSIHERKKSNAHMEPQGSAKLNRNDDILKDKLSLVRRDSPLMKPTAQKRKNIEIKSNKKTKKDRFSLF